MHRAVLFDWHVFLSHHWVVHVEEHITEAGGDADINLSLSVHVQILIAHLAYVPVRRISLRGRVDCGKGLRLGLKLHARVIIIVLDFILHSQCVIIKLLSLLCSQ